MAPSMVDRERGPEDRGEAVEAILKGGPIGVCDRGQAYPTTSWPVSWRTPGPIGPCGRGLREAHWPDCR
jgi:hypothetical protein